MNLFEGNLFNNSITVWIINSNSLFLLQNCPDLVTEDLIRRLCSSAVEGALSLLSNADTIMRNFLSGPNAADLKVLLAMLR